MKDKIEKNSLKVVVLALGMFGSAGLYAGGFQNDEYGAKSPEEWELYQNHSDSMDEQAFRRLPESYKFSFWCRMSREKRVNFFRLLSLDDKKAAWFSFFKNVWGPEDREEYVIDRIPLTKQDIEEQVFFLKILPEEFRSRIWDKLNRKVQEIFTASM